MSEASTPIIQYTVEGTSQDVPLSPTTPPASKVDLSQVDVMTADSTDMLLVLGYLADQEVWSIPFCHYLLDRTALDSIDYVRFVFNARHTTKESFLELISSDASIRSYHTPGEEDTTKTEVAGMLRADYVGRYPHFLLVAARRYMLVNAYPNASFQWAEGIPCYMDRR